MGAIGTVYGSFLFEKYKDDFAVIATGSRYRKIKDNGVVLNGHTFWPRVMNPEVESEKVELLLICVKNDQLFEALKEVAQCVDEHTMVLPLLNGIVARDFILTRYPFVHVFYGLCIKIDAINQCGAVVNTENGLIQFGDKSNLVESEKVKITKDLLASAGLNVIVYDDMERMVWKKWMMNVGCNQVTALTGARYGQITSNPQSKQLLRRAMMEVLELATAASIDLRMDDLEEILRLFDHFSPEGKTSMLQDIENKRKTEVDYFAGTVMEMGQKWNLPTPVNETLYCLIKAKEQTYDLTKDV